MTGIMKDCLRELDEIARRIRAARVEAASIDADIPLWAWRKAIEEQQLGNLTWYLESRARELFRFCKP